MITMTSTSAVSTKTILFLDPEHILENSGLSQLSGTNSDYRFLHHDTYTLPTDDCEAIVFVVNGYKRETKDAIETAAEAVPGTKLFVMAPSETEPVSLFPYLMAESLTGLMSLEYFQKELDFVFRQSGASAFLEPRFHAMLIREIERVKLKEQPIKRLVLQKEEVEGVLTMNEQNVLQLLLEGYNNIHIAQQLFLAPSTISTIISHLLKKLNASDRTDALVTSIRNGWVDAYR
ncbi:response regulator transcription factor [Alteribacter natronophilus]|uniref:response regulator transcription factor n=1 Tax=Alteribacter natronophilus TaxID=2583810 RepID=UPI00110EC3BF|nr:LuxR C-terminal-related transcriptional regulator [Alteribacter natronophilus]TMW72377.1 response regulator transcription factor [Alteribacter natronophilus]